MTPGSNGRHERGEFARARALAELNDSIQRGRAARTVAGHATDAGDFRRLLSMLGLEGEPGANPLSKPL